MGRPKRIVTALAAGVALCMCVVAAPAGETSRRIVVVGDHAYAPLEYRDLGGNARGILVDIWRLWSRKTGIRVTHRCMPWTDALTAVRDGQADVIGGLFYSEKRAETYDFSTPYFEIPTHIFFHHSIYGIKGLRDLSGFQIGVVREDYAAEYLAEHFSEESIVYFDGYQAMVEAAADGTIRVFVCDTPVAMYYLARSGKYAEFRRSPRPLFSSAFRAAVRKGDTELLELVNQGFAAISEAEIQELAQRWTGDVPHRPFPWGRLVAGLAAAAACVIAVTLWNVQLRRRVASATRALRESEERYRAIFDTADDGIALIDPETTAVKEVNARILDLLGITIEEALHIRPGELGVNEAPYTVETAAELLRKTVEGPQRFEWPARHPDGTQFWIEVSLKRARIGDEECVVALIRDITERRQADEELRKLSQYQGWVIDNAHVWLDVLDAQGRVLLWNKAAENISGYARGEVLGSDAVLAWLYPDEAYRADIIGKWMGMTRTGETIEDYETTIRVKSGESRVVAWSSRCLLDASGGVMGFIDIGLDMTERRRLEEQLRHAQKMEAIGQLAGGIAHDFNNLLGGILGYADLLEQSLSESGETEKLATFATVIKDTCQRAADLTARLLVFSRRSAFQPRPIDIHDTVRKVIGLLEHTMDRRIEIHQKLEAAPSTIRGDAAQIQNAVLNLAVNARDAMPNGGALTFATAVVSLGPDYCARQAYRIEPGRYIEIDISDTGVGMDANLIQHIFDPFFTTKGVGKGTGLGLAAVYGAVKAHNGITHVYSEPGVGSVFKLYLPLHEETGAKPEAFADAIVRGAGLVLVVDDEAVIRQMAGEMLRRIGYEVLVAEDGLRALELYRERGADIDLVLLDMVMPKMNGRETLKALKELNPDVRVLVASGFSYGAELQGVLQEGARGFVQKPFLLAELSQEIARVLGGASA